MACLTQRQSNAVTIISTRSPSQEAFEYPSRLTASRRAHMLRRTHAEQLLP